MKTRFVILLAALILVFACSEERKLEVLSTEAFAYSLDYGWELNASANVAGFMQNEEESGEYTAKLSYSVHLVTPEQDTLYEADYGYIDKVEEEEIIDIQIESQMEIDSSFSTGSYTLIFDITDDYSQDKITAVKVFSLTKD